MDRPQGLAIVGVWATLLAPGCLEQSAAQDVPTCKQARARVVHGRRVPTNADWGLSVGDVMPELRLVPRDLTRDALLNRFMVLACTIRDDDVPRSGDVVEWAEATLSGKTSGPVDLRELQMTAWASTGVRGGRLITVTDEARWRRTEPDDLVDEDAAIAVANATASQLIAAGALVPTFSRKLYGTRTVRQPGYYGGARRKERRGTAHRVFLADSVAGAQLMQSTMIATVDADGGLVELAISDIDILEARPARVALSLGPSKVVVYQLPELEPDWAQPSVELNYSREVGWGKASGIYLRSLIEPEALMMDISIGNRSSKMLRPQTAGGSL